MVRMRGLGHASATPSPRLCKPVCKSGLPCGAKTFAPHLHGRVRSRAFIPNVIPTTGVGITFGAPEDRCLEPLESISDWLLSSPDVDWNLQLRNASLSRFVPQYQL